MSQWRCERMAGLAGEPTERSGLASSVRTFQTPQERGM
jgi:hypothetical protein